MKMPWVSRELYNRVSADLEKSEAERKRLLDLMLGVGTPDPLASLAEALPDPASREAEDLIDPITGTLSAAKIRAMATSAMYKRAGRIA